MSKRTRRKYSSQQKADILKKHHVDKVPVSEICNAASLQPSVFYVWQKHFFDNAATVFDGLSTSAGSAKSDREKLLEAKVAHLEAKLAKKDAVIAEISEEFVKVKKNLGEP